MNTTGGHKSLIISTSLSLLLMIFYVSFYYHYNKFVDTPVVSGWGILEPKIMPDSESAPSKTPVCNFVGRLGEKHIFGGLGGVFGVGYFGTKK